MADILLKQANLSEIPLRILSALPTTLPAAGYAHLLAQDTADGKRAFLRLPDGSLVSLFTDITNNVVDNSTHTLIYQIQDLPAPATLADGEIPIVLAGVWGHGLIAPALVRQALWNHRGGDTVTGNKTLGLYSDTDVYLSCTAAATLTLSSAVAWPLWCEFEIARNTSGAVSIVCGGTTTINGSQTSLSISKQYGIVVLKNIGANMWVAYGDFA
jgi:hypothetical protein